MKAVRENRKALYREHIEGGYRKVNFWNGYITRKDLETEPGIVDQEKIQALSVNLYTAGSRC